MSSVAAGFCSFCNSPEICVTKSMDSALKGNSMVTGASTVSTRQRLPALESAPQAQIQGIQQKCEESRPGHGSDERHENQQQRIAQSGCHDEGEYARIKTRWGWHRGILAFGLPRAEGRRGRSGRAAAS